MKLDINALRYISQEEFRVLTAVEMGQKNHEIVPASLIDNIAGLKHGGTYRCLKTLLRHKLLHHDNSKYDGFRLTYMGYDFLAIRALCAKGLVASVGTQIGVGKESDIYEVMSPEGEVQVLKLHRLGRTSFRAVKSKRDYLKHRSSFSWLYLSRLAALKEFAFMRALGERGFPTPTAIENNRHAVLMSMVDGSPLVQVRRVGHPEAVYAQCMELAARLAGWGLVHCDFNEFNLMVDEHEKVTCIDFPQMVSVSHANARELFERDVECIARFFRKKMNYVPEDERAARPDFDAAVATGRRDGGDGGGGLDVALAASGFSNGHQAILEQAFADAGGEDGADGGGDGGGGAAPGRARRAAGQLDARGGARDVSGSEEEEEGEGVRAAGEEPQALGVSDAVAGAATATPSPTPAPSGRPGSAGNLGGGSDDACSSGSSDEGEEGGGAGARLAVAMGATSLAAGSEACQANSSAVDTRATGQPRLQQQQQGEYAAAKMARERRREGMRTAKAHASRNAAKDKKHNSRRSAANAAVSGGLF